jgi:hypothetical protein
MFLLLALSFFSTFTTIHNSEDEVDYKVVLNENTTIPFLAPLVDNLPHEIRFKIYNDHLDQKSWLTLTEVNKSFCNAFTIELNKDVRYRTSA